jgi:hypothetical protein
MQVFAVLPVPTFAGMAECYTMPQPRLPDEVATLGNRVEEHLKQMEAPWK